MERNPQKEAAFTDAVKQMYGSLYGYMHELMLRGEMKLPDFGEVYRFFNKKLETAKSIAEELQDPKRHMIVGMAFQHILKVIDAKNHWRRFSPTVRKRKSR